MLCQIKISCPILSFSLYASRITSCLSHTHIYINNQSLKWKKKKKKKKYQAYGLLQLIEYKVEHFEWDKDFYSCFVFLSLSLFF